MDNETIAMGPMWYVSFLLAITVHEAAHAWAAKLGGDDTAYEEGQVTLNPLPHIKREPMGTILVPWVSFFYMGWMIGWASAPYDPDWQRRFPHRSAWMALAGPAANFVLVLLAALLIHIGIALEFFVQPKSITMTSVVQAATPGIADGAAVLLSLMFFLNLLLGIFNLIPVPPLDGATVIGLFFREEKAAQVIETLHNSQFAFFGLIIAWGAFDTIFDPVYTLALNLLYPGSNYS